MQTPLSTVTEPFIETIHSELRQQHDESEGERSEAERIPYRPDPYYCFQGRPSRFGERPDDDTQRINPRLTAWHYRFTPGTVLSFTNEPHLVD